MAINEKGEHVEAADYTAATGASHVITWTANEPTAANTQTIADGAVPTVAELGQSVANLTAILNAVIVDVAALKADLA
jgi:hypothetical protein